jgi:hypothetical protein
MFFAQMFDKLIARQHAALDLWVVSYCCGLGLHWPERPDVGCWVMVC